MGADRKIPFCVPSSPTLPCWIALGEKRRSRALASRKPVAGPMGLLAFALWSRSILRSLESGCRRPPGLFEHPTLGTNAAPLLSWRHMGAGWVRGRWPSSRDAPEGIVHPQPTPTACDLLSASKQGWGQPLLCPATALACCVALSWAHYMPLRGIVHDHHAPRKTGPWRLICCLWRARGRPRLTTRRGQASGDAPGVRFLAPCGRPCGTYWPSVSTDTCPLRYISAVEALLYQI